MTKAYSYARWSDPRQGKGDSEDRQLSAAREYAAEHGLILDTSLIDRGVSGYTGANRTRGDLGRFLEMVKQGVVKEGEYLLVDSMDRLSRLPLGDAAAQLLNLANSGVRVVTLNDGLVFDRNVDISTMINAVLKIQGAHEYSRELGRKVKRGHAAAKLKAREGRIYSKTGPGWLKLNLERTAWIEIPERVDLVRRVFDWADHGGLGQRVIANRLNTGGEKPFRWGKGWHEVSVQKLLKNRMVLGEYQPRFRGNAPHGDPIPGYYGAGIIDPAQFYRVQGRFGRRRGRGNGPRQFNNLLQGLCECALCGSIVGVAIRSRDKRPLYICRNTADGMRCENRTRYRVAEFETALLSQLFDVELGPRPSTSGSSAALQRALAERDDLQSRIDTFVRRMELPGWEPDLHMLAYHRTRVEERKLKDAEISSLSQTVEVELARPGPVESQAEIRGIAAQFSSLKGADLYDARARLSAALKNLVNRVYFNGPPQTEPLITVFLMGGAKVITIRPDGRARSVDFVDEMPADMREDLINHFSDGNPLAEQRLRGVHTTPKGRIPPFEPSGRD